MYFITTVGEDDKRCVGYVSTLEEARHIVENNMYDLWEAGCYPYAVIENIKEGLYEYDFEPIWFKYNEEKEMYEDSDTPNYIEKNDVGFAIG